MKNIFESIAVVLVAIFSLAIIVLIIQYNLIQEEEDEGFHNSMMEAKQVSKKDKNINYLKNLEQHSEVEVKVDPRKETSTNKIKVKSEFTKDKLESVLKENQPNAVIEGIDDLLK